MAEKYQPILSQGSAQPFIAPVVQSNLAPSITAIGKLGVDAYTGYQTAETAKGYEADINAYLQSQQEAESRKNIFELDMSNKVKAEDEMWNSAGVVPEHIGLGGDGTDEFTGAAPGGRMVNAGDIDQVQQGMSRTMEKFLQAQRQGRMSIGQLEARILDTTRRAIARNPFLQDELLRAGQKYMDLSGASAYMKGQMQLEKSAAEKQEEVYKQHVDWAKKYGVPMTRPNWFEEAAQAAVLDGEHSRKVAYMDEALKKRTFKQNELADIVNDPATRQKHMQGEMLKHRSTYTRLNNLAQFSTNDKVLAMNQEIDQSINFLESIAGQLPAGSTGAVSGQIALLNKQKELYKDLLTGGPNAEAAKNTLSFAESVEKLPYVSDNVKLDMINKRLSALRTVAGEAGQLPFNQDEAAALMQYLKVDLPPGSISPLAGVKLNTPSGKQAVNTAFALIDPTMADNARAVNSDTINTGIKHIEATPDGTQAAQLTDTMLEQLISQAKASNLPITALLDDTSLSNLNKYITGVMGNARDDEGKVDYNPNTNAFSYLDKEGKINQAGSDRANKMFKALILVNGFKDEDTIDKWGATFSGQKFVAGTAPVPSGQGWSASTLADLEKARDAGHITIEQFYQMAEDFVTKSKVSGGATTTPDRSIPEVTSKALLGTVVPEGMNPGASGQITQSATPLPKGTPRKVEQPAVKPVQLTPKLVESPASVKVREALGVGAPKPVQEKIPVYQETSRILESPKGKWVVFSESKGKVRMYSPIEKVYVDIKTSDIPFFEKAFKLPKAQWKKWGK